jgi:hypothetical protein
MRLESFVVNDLRCTLVAVALDNKGVSISKISLSVKNFLTVDKSFALCRRVAKDAPGCQLTIKCYLESISIY